PHRGELPRDGGLRDLAPVEPGQVCAHHPGVHRGEARDLLLGEEAGELAQVRGIAAKGMGGCAALDTEVLEEGADRRVHRRYAGLLLTRPWGPLPGGTRTPP